MNKDEFLEVLQKRGFTKYQLNIDNIERIEFEAIDNKLKSLDKDKSVNFNIDAYKDKKTVSLSSNYLDYDLVDLLEEKVNSIEKEVEIDLNGDISHNNIINLRQELDINTYLDDLVLLSKKTKEKTDTVYIGVVAYKNKKSMINNLGLRIEEANLNYLVYISVYAKDKDLSKSSYYVSLEKSLDIKKLQKIKEDLEEANLKLNLKDIKSQKYQVLFKEDIVENFLNALVEGINLKNIKYHNSFLKNKLNKKVFGENVTIIEDPGNDEFSYVRYFDDEGVKTKKKKIVDKGVLKTYLSDIKTAKLFKEKTSGNSYDSSIDVVNFYLKTGNKTYEDILKSIDKGLIINDIKGSENSIDITEDKITYQVEGFYVENGEIKHSFDQAVMNITISDLFKNIIEISSDLKRTGINYLAPAILVKDVNIIK